MKISGSDTTAYTPSYTGVSSTLNKVQQRGFDILPNVTCGEGRVTNVIKKAGEKISSAEQRLILGASALMSQPFIDAKNKNVDEKTRKVSVARTIAKIVAGTFTGFVIRKACIKSIKALSHIPQKGVPKWKSILTPEGITDNKTDAFSQYRNAVGTIVALVVMLFTNFLIDAPLTKFLTNTFIQKGEDKK